MPSATAVFVAHCPAVDDGVDSRQLLDKLCPTVGINDNPRLKYGQNGAASTVPDIDPTASWTGLNCTALFSHLLHGFAGTLTPKQLIQLKTMYKSSIDYATSDKVIKAPAGRAAQCNMGAGHS
eukprot:GHRQ01022398.1.p2 GENE.GHRQ01022398.1~~GHRQ01022398.1.p2  ORF type:complete len:123 (+),score=46.44 GHRQ01022398.1:642-1010(+)